MTKQSQGNYEGNKRRPDSDYLQRAGEIGADVLYILTGRRSPASSTILAGFAEAAAERIEPAINGSPEALRQGFLPIPFHPGNNSHRGVAPIAIARSWLDDRGLLPDNLSFVLTDDGGMQPTIPAVALLLVDSGRRRPEPGTLVCLVHQSRLAAGRFYPGVDGHHVIQFDHPGTAPILTGPGAAALQILGTVIGTFNPL